MDLPVISRRTRFTASREHVRGYDAFRLNGSHVFSSKERERERNLLIVGSWNGDFKKTFSCERNPLRSDRSLDNSERVWIQM